MGLKASLGTTLKTTSLTLSLPCATQQRVKLALGSLRGSTGVLDGGGQPREGRREIAQMPKLAQGEMKLMTTLEQVKEQTLDKASNDMIQIGHKDEKVTMSIPDSLLFAQGETNISPGAYPFLDDLAAVVAQSKATVEFIGHSDNTTPGGYYQSNWEVAAARSLAVLTYVENAGSVPGYRLKASSKGEYQPRSANSSDSGRASNRRVELVFTTTSASDRYFYGEERVAPPVFPAGDGDGGE